MEDYAIDIVIGQGPAARSIRLDIPRFTLIAATTRTGMLTGPLRDRFGAAFHMDYYSSDELKDIVVRSATILSIDIDDARCVRDCLARTCDAASGKSSAQTRARLFASALQRLHRRASRPRGACPSSRSTELGLDPMDNRILDMLVNTFEGRPVGLSALASALGEEVDSIEDVYEPFLLKQGLVNRTPKGRQATHKAFAHLGVPYPVD